jgi:phosphatidyl-myo-inositol alpha-mannosyltransferase
MRIAQVCPYAWDAPGGVQVHVGELSAHLRSRGHEVLVVAPSLKRVRDAGVAVAGRAVRVRYQGTVAPIAPLAWAKVRAILRGWRPDVVHVHEPLTPSASMAAAMSAPAPVVATFHAHSERSRLFDLAAPVLRGVWRRLDARIAVSETAGRFVSDRLGDGIRVIPNGVDVERFGSAAPAEDLPPGRRLLWVGRLDPQKGFRVAVRAFERLASVLPDLTFVVAGDGKDRSPLEALPLPVRERVIVLGTVDRGRLPRYHAAADAFVSPAVGQESFGIVLVESMAAGLPVVATDIPGYHEVVDDGVEGLLVPPGDSVALEAALRRVLEDEELAKSLGESGRARARRYTWDVVGREIEAVCAEVLGGP